MRKSIVLALSALVVVLLVALAPGVSTATVGDANGPACRDITSGTFNYTDNGTGTFNLNGLVVLGDSDTTAPCKNVTYTLYVIVDGTNPADAIAYPQSGSNTWTGITITDDDTSICVFATTSTGRVFDTAPDVGLGCAQVTAGPTGNPGGFN